MSSEPSYLIQEDTPADPSNGDVDPTATDVHRKLQCACTFGSGSCLLSSCENVTASSVIGDGSCTNFQSCLQLDGTYTMIIIQECIVCCILHVNSTNSVQLFFCKAMLVITRAPIMILVLDLLVRIMITLQVYFVWYYMSTQLTVCNSFLLNKVLLAIVRALVMVPVIILLVRIQW